MKVINIEPPKEHETGEERGYSPTSTKCPKIILNGIESEAKALI